jgi:hypothetical protein
MPRTGSQATGQQNGGSMSRPPLRDATPKAEDLEAGD